MLRNTWLWERLVDNLVPNLLAILLPPLASCRGSPCFLHLLSPLASPCIASPSAPHLLLGPCPCNNNFYLTIITINTTYYQFLELQADVRPRVDCFTLISYVRYLLEVPPG